MQQICDERRRQVSLLCILVEALQVFKLVFLCHVLLVFGRQLVAEYFLEVGGYEGLHLFLDIVSFFRHQTGKFVKLFDCKRVEESLANSVFSMKLRVLLVLFEFVNKVLTNLFEERCAINLEELFGPVDVFGRVNNPVSVLHHMLWQKLCPVDFILKARETIWIY